MNIDERIDSLLNDELRSILLTPSEERATVKDFIRDVLAEITFITYTGEPIRLCSNCPQFKQANGGWEITQCNDCRALNEANIKKLGL